MLAKKQITLQIENWIEDIDYDIRDDFKSRDEKDSAITQRTQLSMALGLLQNLGENDNIKEE